MIKLQKDKNRFLKRSERYFSQIDKTNKALKQLNEKNPTWELLLQIEKEYAFIDELDAQSKEKNKTARQEEAKTDETEDKTKKSKFLTIFDKQLIFLKGLLISQRLLRRRRPGRRKRVGRDRVGIVQMMGW